MGGTHRGGEADGHERVGGKEEVVAVGSMKSPWGGGHQRAMTVP